MSCVLCAVCVERLSYKRERVKLILQRFLSLYVLSSSLYSLFPSTSHHGQSRRCANAAATLDPAASTSSTCTRNPSAHAITNAYIACTMATETQKALRGKPRRWSGAGSAQPSKEENAMNMAGAKGDGVSPLWWMSQRLPTTSTKKFPIQAGFLTFEALKNARAPQATPNDVPHANPSAVRKSKSRGSSSPAGLRAEAKRFSTQLAVSHA